MTRWPRLKHTWRNSMLGKRPGPPRRLQRRVDPMPDVQTKCGRTACRSTHLTHYNGRTDKLYCPACARKINESNPWLCSPLPETTARILDGMLARIRKATTPT